MLKNKREFSPKIILLITVILAVAVLTASIVIVNVNISGWQIGEIFVSVGTAFFIIGSILIAAVFAGGTKIPNVYLHTRNYKMAKVDSEYAKEQRGKFPWLGSLFLLTGGIFLAIGFAFW